jgi:hypothetical protein
MANFWAYKGGHMGGSGEGVGIPESKRTYFRPAGLILETGTDRYNRFEGM